MVLAQTEGTRLMTGVFSKKWLRSEIGWPLLLVMLSIPVPGRADSEALILGGVPGSPLHETRFADWIEATRIAMVETFGFGEDNVVVLQNREARGEDIRNAFASFAERLTADDTFFLFFIGHGSFDGTEYKFNTMGADLTAADYSEMLDSIDAGRAVVVNATNSSGGAIEQFAAENRVVVTATRTGTERNDTIFYDHFLEALDDAASDEDKNERLSVWEAFRYATLAVERFYEEQNRLATEHPQISDNGREKTGVDPDEMPSLARLINFNAAAEINVADPVLRTLLEERNQLESDIEALRFIQDTMSEQEYELGMEELLIELALKNQEARAREANTSEADPAEPNPAEQN
jgi:hypothetical protein